MNFSFFTPNEIVFGNGKIAGLPNLVKRFGTHAFICVRGQSLADSGVLERIRQHLQEQHIDVFLYHQPDGEPTVQDVDRGVELARQYQPDVVIGIGGGSSLDTAKAIAGMIVHTGSVYDYLEGVGHEQIVRPGLPFIAVPTTAGTGAEVTKNAVISSTDEHFKKSLRSEHLLARVVLLDPEMTVTMPPRITAETGMDALTQLIESYTSLKAQPIPQSLCLSGVQLVGSYLRRAVHDGSDLEAREGMLLASLLSGISLANSGLGAAHGIAAALGAWCQVPHGRACAMLLPKVLQFNLPDCITPYSTLYSQLSGFPVDSELAAAEAFIDRIERLSHEIGIPQYLAAAELPEERIPDLVAGSYGSSMSGNPVPMTDADVEAIIRQLLKET
jgi:alcohol dehydrogenase class IV